MVDIGTDDLMHVVPFNVPYFVRRPQRLEVLLPVAQRLCLTRVIGHVPVSAAEICVDVVLRNALAHDLRSEIAERQNRTQALLTYVVFDRTEIVADARHDLPAIAA